jgi:arylformamidase
MNPFLTDQYLDGQMRPHHATLLPAFQQASDAAATLPNAALDIAYGGHARERFDFFTSEAAWRGTLVYFHAGYWQSRDKAQFRFLAPRFMAHGIDVAMVNYPLCPDVSLFTLIDATRTAIPAVLAHARAGGRGGKRLVAAGHSAGGHIAVELALTEWTTQGLSASPIAAVVSLSGVFDLAPLIRTPLNDKLQIDAATARMHSPLHRVRSGMPAAVFAVGGAETPAFLAQNAAMSAAWSARGNSATTIVIDDADHFTLLREIDRPGPLMQHILGLFT